MALGTCRHCGARRIPTDAPICRECGGWRPNPGFFTRLGVLFYRLFAALVLLVLLAGCAVLVTIMIRSGAGAAAGWEA
jgi:hypothetical protein